MQDTPATRQNFYLEERREAILRALNLDAKVRVSELSELFGVSSATIRKDIRALEGAGKLRRTHGGAIPVRSSDVEEKFEVAETTAHDQKARIGQAAARLVTDGDVLFVQSGTTCLELTKALIGKSNLTLITSDLSIAIKAEEVLKDSTIVMLGGTLRCGYHYTQGPDALKQLEGYYAPTAFLCANAFSFERGITAHRREQADWVNALIRSSDKHVLLLDSGKIGQNAPARVTDLDPIDVFVTDSDADANVRASFLEYAPDLEVIYA